MSLHKIKAAVDAAEGNARQMGEVVLMIAQADEHAAEVIAAIDYAVSVVGFEGVARDYWPHVQAEARRIWREMRAAGFLDRQENPSP